MHPVAAVKQRAFMMVTYFGYLVAAFANMPPKGVVAIGPVFAGRVSTILITTAPELVPHQRPVARLYHPFLYLPPSLTAMVVRLWPLLADCCL